MKLNVKLSSKKGLKPEFSKDGTHLKPEAYVVWCNDISQLLSKYNY